MDYFLAIDQGTHSSRACLFDETGKLVSSKSKTISLKRINTSHVEQDADEIVESVMGVISALLDETSTDDKIVACGIAIQRSSVLAWQSDGRAISPILSWQDTRGLRQLEKLNKHETEIQQLSGLPLSAHYGASKLNFLLNKFDRINSGGTKLRISPLISYLLFHILEHHPYIVDHGNAQRTQLFGIKELNWSRQLTDLFGIPIKLLPDCVSVLSKYDTPHGFLSNTQIPVYAISGDQNAAIYGTGKLDSTTALVNLGTGAFVLRLLKHYKTSERQLSGIGYSEDENIQYIREATINGAGSALTWLEENHKNSDIRNLLPVWLDDIKRPPVFINTIGGLGSPWWRNDIKPDFITTENLSNEVEPDIATKAVSIIESIVFMIYANLDIMHDEQTLTHLRISGGLSNLDGLCQRLANLSGLTVERLDQPDATARGVAWLAAGRPDGWSDVSFDQFIQDNDPELETRYRFFFEALSKSLKETA